MMTFKLYSFLLLFSYIQFTSLVLETRSEIIDTAGDQCKHLSTDIYNSKKSPKSTFQVFHMYGPCSPTGVAGTSPIDMPSALDILHHDQLRVESLQSQFKHTSETNKYDSRFQDTKEVASLPASEFINFYGISISLGAPQQIHTLIFDTGSSLTWTRDFKYYASDSFSSVSCDSDLCTQLLPIHTCEMFDDKENMCYYNNRYLVGQHTKGVFSKDILNITQTGDVFPEFLFGSATEVVGNFKAGGFLGLGRENVSFITQTNKTYKGVFSYYLPSNPNSTGFLKLGPMDYYDNLKYTPLMANSSYPSSYIVNIISIKVGDVKLLIGKFGYKFQTIIDSGTVITRLPMNVYKTMRDELKKQLSSFNFSSVTSPSSLLDTCYANSEYPTNFIPPITFTFKGGVVVVMDNFTTFYTVTSSIVCLAFSGNKDAGDLAIFGSHQQRKLEVVYDIYGGKLSMISPLSIV